MSGPSALAATLLLMLPAWTLWIYTGARLVENRENDSWNQVAHDELARVYGLLDRYVEQNEFTEVHQQSLKNYFNFDFPAFNNLDLGQQDQVRAALEEGKLLMETAKKDDIWLLKASQRRNIVYFLVASAFFIGISYYMLPAFAFIIAGLTVTALLVATIHDAIKIAHGSTKLNQVDGQLQEVGQALGYQDRVNPIVQSGWMSLFRRQRLEIAENHEIEIEMQGQYSDSEDQSDDDESAHLLNPNV